MKHLVMMILVTTVTHALPNDDDEPIGLDIIVQTIRSNHAAAQQRVEFFAQKLATCTEKEKLFYAPHLLAAQKEQENNAQLLAKQK